MSLARRFLLLLVGSVVLSACADDSGVPTPSGYLTPTPKGQAAVVYVLTQRMVPGYQRTLNAPLTPGGLASENSQPALEGELQADGFVNGARVQYAPPTGNHAALAWDTISSDAIVFGDDAGAGRYFAAEAKRVDTATQSASLSAIPGLPRANVDDLVAFQSALPPPQGAEVERAFIALLRRGRVVTQIFARGTSASRSDVVAFVPLVAAQETLLALQPTV